MSIWAVAGHVENYDVEAPLIIEAETKAEAEELCKQWLRYMGDFDDDVEVYIDGTANVTACMQGLISTPPPQEA